MARTPLSDDEIRSALGGLPGWEYADDSVRKSFQFGTFREAVSFLIRVSFEAEQLDHHPEIHNVYNRVTLTLRTHDAGDKVTRADIDLATAIESFSWV